MTEVRPQGAVVTVAVVDDDPVTRQILVAWLEDGGHTAVEMDNGRALLESDRELDVVCLDLGLEDMQGADVLAAYHRLHPRATVLVVTRDRNVETAVESMRLGAYDYVTKPLDRERFMLAFDRAVERTTLMRRAEVANRATPTSFGGIVGQSPPVRRLVGQIERVLDSDIAVCIHGESGTGKELVARAIHEQGRRGKGPFVALNCAAIPQSLQESELFGHERGAFTGAVAAHRGRFEQAHRGTLFLDEIGEMSAATQASVLRALQERSIRRVGSAQDVSIDVRVICATHRDLEAEVAAGRFRQDLYFRLVVYPITVPPLRERRDDVPLLVAHIMRELREETKHTIVRVAPEALEAFSSYDWPGNVRELRNVLHRAIVSCGGDTIELADLPGSLTRAVPSASATFRANAPVRADASTAAGATRLPTLRELEREAIVRALATTGNNVTRAAKLLGLGRATLYRRLTELEIVVSRSGT